MKQAAVKLKPSKLAQNGDVLLELRRPWPTPDGVSVLRFSPLDVLRRLAAIIAPPHAHTVRYFGLFAPNATYRDMLPAAPVRAGQTGRVLAEIPSTESVWSLVMDRDGSCGLP